MQTIMEFVKDYFIAIAFLIILIMSMVIKRVFSKQKKGKKKVVEEKGGEEVSEESDEEEEKNASEESKKEEKPIFFEDFDLEEEKNKKKPIINEIEEVGCDLDRDGVELEEKTMKDIEALKQELVEVIKRKEEIRKHGFNLAKLFTQYRKREYNINKILAGLELLVKRKEYIELKDEESN